MQFKPVAVRLEGANRRKSCAGCIYRRGIGSRGDRYKVCHYCIDTGAQGFGRAGVPRGGKCAGGQKKEIAEIWRQGGIAVNGNEMDKC